jgi:hypothetical protein
MAAESASRARPPNGSPGCASGRSRHRGARRWACRCSRRGFRVRVASGPSIDRNLCHAAAAGPRIAAARADRIICAFVAGERLTNADHPDRGRRSRQTFPGVCSEGNDASRAHPAGGPRNSRPAPRIPATARLESPAHGPNPRPCPLSPEAPRPACHAGGRGFESSRSRNIPAIGILCCRFRRKRPLVSSSSRVHRARESPYEAGGSREFPQPMVPAGTTGGRFGVRRDSMRSLIDDSSLRWIPLHSVRPLRSPARPLPSAAAGLPLPASRATHPGGAAARSSSLT